MTEMDLSAKVKGKKVSLKHFINTSLKGRIGADGIVKYPLYTQVVYNRGNIKFKSSINPLKNDQILVPYRPDLPNKFEEINDPRLIDVDNKILNIIKYEVENNGQDFKLSRLGIRIPIYFKSVDKIILEQILMGYDGAWFESQKEEIVIETALMNNLVHILLQSYCLGRKKISCYDWLIEGADKDFEYFLSTKGPSVTGGHISNFEQLQKYAPEYVTTLLGYILDGPEL
jgi:hypothetical protein